MGYDVVKTSAHTLPAGTFVAVEVGGEKLFPTYLVTSDGSLVAAANALYVQPGTGASWAITAASLPLPSGAATSAKQDSQTTHLATLAGAVSGTEVQVDVVSMPTVTIQDGGGSITVDGTVAVSGSVVVTNAGTFAVQAAQSGAWNITNISGTVSLPTGAATAAKQPALGTAGTASGDVITVQGIAGMTALKVDGSAVTQPVSVAAAVAVTDNSGSLTVDAPVGTPVFVRLSDGATAITTLPVSMASVPAHDVTNAGTFAVQVSSSALPTGAATDAKQPALGTAGTPSADVISIQGVSGGTAVPASQSGSWTVTVDSAPLPTGSATAANQGTIISSLSSIDGHVDGVESSLSSIDAKITACNTGAVVVSSSALPTGASTAARQDTTNTHLATIAGAVSGTEVQVDVLTMPTVTVADGGGSLTVDGTVAATQSGAWSVSVSGSVAVTDDSGSLTVDAPVGTPLFVRLSDGASAITTLPVSLASVPSHDVTNAGTFAVQVSSALPAGTNAIGKLAANAGVTIGAVEIAAAQTLGTVTTVSTVTNISQLGGAAIAMGTGTRSAGTQRVTIATDDVVPCSQSGTWNVGTVTTCSTVSTLTGGGVAHDSADSGNPVKVGAKAVSTQSGQTAVASGDRTDVIADLDGTLIARNVPHGDLVTGLATTTGTSDTSVVAAQGTSTYLYVDCITAVNTGSSAALLTFKDGSGGSALWYAIVPAGGGIVIAKGGKPIFRTSANTALHFAAGTASTTIYVSVSGYKSKV